MSTLIVLAALALGIGTVVAQKKGAAKSAPSYYKDGG